MQRWKLSRKAAQRIEAGQVWVYRGEFQQELTPETLEEVLLVDERGRLLGSALVDGSSPVPVRLYSRREQSFDGPFLQQRIEAAVAWRRLVVGKGNTGYRLVFGESDGLPGLIVDRFGDSIAIQVNLRNYVKVIAEIVSGLIASLGGLSDSAVIVVEENGVRRLVSGTAENAIAFYRLNDLLFEADLLGGPKTGAFLDQRENYLATALWAEKLELEGRALDLFSSSGGFALHLSSRLNSVDAVDSSQSAVARIQKNAVHNGIENVRAIESDVKQFLRGLGQARRRYECVIADPPAFAKQTRQKEEATRAYYELNLRALSAVAPSGLFVSCSCSKVITEQNFITILREACQESRKSLTLLEKRGQAIDHREILEIPESSYLKCLLFRVSSLQ